MISFIDILNEHIDTGKFVKLTLSKPRLRSEQLKNIYVKPVEIKNEIQYSFTYRHSTRDETKNYDVKTAKELINGFVSSQFQNAVLIATDEEVNLITTKKGAQNISRKRAVAVAEVSHDKIKKVYTELHEPYLNLLGVTDDAGNLIPRMADKYRQINKYLETVDHLIQSVGLANGATIVDMGSGKGYLTFALYNYFTNTLNIRADVTGVEQRSDLVRKCNEIAKACNFGHLKFVESTIQDYPTDKLDMLIALHACDTATDDAIAKGIKAGAAIIVCAPCCHKQIRQQLKGRAFDNPILKYGIYKERFFEMVTDTLRALILETHGYKSNLFEFISSEHTSKNVMLTAIKSNTTNGGINAQEKIDQIKSQLGIDFHYLERLVDAK